MRYLNLLLLLNALLFSACHPIYELSEEDRDELTRNDDNLVYKSGIKYRYTLRYFGKDTEERGLLMTEGEIPYDNAFPVVDCSSAEYPHRIKYVDMLVEEARHDNVLNRAQSTIRYEYYTADDVLIPFASTTGLVDNKYNIWVHPPRNSALKVLNMSAYPFVKFPLEVGKKWDYDLRVGRLWGHTGFGPHWKEEDVPVFTHSYEIREKLNLKIRNQVLECYKIEVNTKSVLGSSSSDFYYNNTYGFVSMNYRNLDGSEIRMELLMD